jgi:hypothetical protein
MRAAIGLALMGILLFSCAPGSNELLSTPDTEGLIAGFWLGLWHGFIAPFTFIVSLFREGVTIYEVHNNGGWYNFGYLIGISAIFGGCGASGCAVKSNSA